MDLKTLSMIASMQEKGFKRQSTASSLTGKEKKKGKALKLHKINNIDNDLLFQKIKRDVSIDCTNEKNWLLCSRCLLLSSDIISLGDIQMPQGEDICVPICKFCEKSVWFGNQLLGVSDCKQKNGIMRTRTTLTGHVC